VSARITRLAVVVRQVLQSAASREVRERSYRARMAGLAGPAAKTNCSVSSGPPVASPAALHDTTALHTVAQISARSTDAGFLAGGIFALAAVVLARCHQRQAARSPAAP